MGYNDYMVEIKQDSIKASGLEGQLLIATPAVQDSCFARSVIYMCAHNASGAMGIIINYPVENLDIKEILDQLEINGAHARTLPVHFGGPVEAGRGFVLHSTDYVSKESIIEGNGIAVTASVSILQDISQGRGPKNRILILGYAGWSAGQLESEIEEGSWMVVPASHKLLFDIENDSKWNVAVGTLGIDIGHYSSEVGHA